MNPRVSFIAANYNYGRYIVEAVDSLLSQTFKDLEVIVIDDASTDNSREILQSHYSDEPRVRLVFHERNRGHIFARNEGLELARGEYVAVMDADDFCYRPDAVEAHVAVLDANPDVTFVYSAFQEVNEQSHPFRLLQQWEQDFVREGLDEFRELIKRNYVPHTGTLIRRSFLDPEGNYDPVLPHSADWDIWLKLSTRGRVGYLSTPYYAYRMHSASLSARYSPVQINGEYFYTLQKAFNHLPKDAPAELRGMRRKAGQQALLNATWGERSHGHIRRSWVGLLDAARRSPSLVVAGSFQAALARLVILTLVGHRRYERLTTLARTRRPVKANAAAS